MTRAKVSLKPWQPVRVWRNRTAITITVCPCVEAFPPGCQIRLFEPADDDGVAPMDGHGPRGDSVALNIHLGNAVFVHIDLSKSSATSVVADTTQEP